MCRALIPICICVAVLAVADLSADCPELIGSAGKNQKSGAGRTGYGSNSEIVVSGGYAFSTGLFVFDVHTPTAPFRIAQLLGITHGLAIQGDYLYVIGRQAELYYLWVLDVSIPSAPLAVGSESSPRSPKDVAVSGGYAYVAEGEYQHPGLRVIDVQIPEYPHETAFFPTSLYRPANSVAASDGYAYLTGGYYGDYGFFLVFDVRNPHLPMELAYFNVPGEGQGVAVSGDYVYVIGTVELSVFDVSTPAATVKVGSAPIAGSDVAVSGNVAYIAGADYGLYAVDVSDPSAPVEMGNWLPPYAGYLVDGVSASSPYAYVNVYDPTYGTNLAVFAGCEFSDGFESGDTSTWSATVP